MTDPALPAELRRALGALDVRIRQVPALGQNEHPIDAARTRMLPALALASAAGRPVIMCWTRPASDRPLSVMTAAGPELRGRTRPDGSVEIALPVGTLGVPLQPGQAMAAVGNATAWWRSEARFDPSAAEELTPTSGSGLEDVFGFLAGRPMAWVIVARPVPRAAVAAKLDDLSLAVAEGATAQGRGSERLRHERSEAELRYLERWSALGFWALEVWSGGRTAAEAQALGALLGGTADLAQLPVRLRPTPAGPAAAANSGETEAPWSPSLVTSAEVIAALARPPAQEMPGLRVVDPSTFDITPEVRGSVSLGQVLDRTLMACGPFSVSEETLNRHTFVTGATGSGKSQTTRQLLEQLSRRGIPWLVIEPVKAEYAGMAGRLAPLGQQVTVIRPGSPDEPPASLNPLEPTSVVIDGRRVTFPLQTHLDFVRALFNAAFEAQEPFPQILSAALTRCYEKLGWNLALGRPLAEVPGDAQLRYPTLRDLQAAALEVVAGLGYGAEVRDNVRGFVTVRINSLRLGTPGRFFEAGHPLDLDALLQRNVVFEIENVGDDNDKAFFIGTVLLRIVELLRLRHVGDASGLRHVLVLEEAHRLLRRAEPGTPAAHAVETFGDLLAEIRAYGEGIVVAEQIPSKIIEDVVKNSALKIVHRLPSADDRAFVGATMNLDEQQSAMVVALPPGRGAVHADGMDRPILVAVDASGSGLEGQPAPTAPPPVARRSASCPDQCTGSPCTLAALERAVALAADPEFVIWVETGVLAHLAGEAVGQPSSEWIQQVRRAGTSDVRCALGQAVDAAVQGRDGNLRTLYDPAALSRHVADALFRRLRSSPQRCPAEPQWRAGPFRWRDVVKSLNADADLDRPHPSTATWATTGLVLPAQPVVHQFLAVQEILRREGPMYRSLVWGEHGALERAIDRLGGQAPSPSSLGMAIRHVAFPSPWLEDVLFRPGVGAP